MSEERMLHLIADEAKSLLAAAESDSRARLHFYPDWTMIDLLVHTGSVHRRTTRVVQERLTERPARVYPEDEDPALVFRWFDDGARQMVEVLAAADPEMHVWGFGPEPSVGFWITRMALETSVHRWDAQQPVGEPEPLDEELAAAGISEFAFMNCPPRPEDCPYDGELLAIRTPAGSWSLSVSSDVFDLRRDVLAPEDPATVVSAPASDVYLWLLGRVFPGRLDIRGDADLVGWWTEVVRSTPPAVR